ncbi:sulfatase [Catenovulum agarivorans DS-2]|uniref:Sulfatase n=1 Tax=Catenovulum agarivorans DS-2 TaxID=1328313 RepID=W7QFQ3_9ALTE|nr:sulfatase-like hydrolase/transferase [Catenovulum agarivorans]EWH10726.1 sulfatase [Catenovulum agarivorans DS-2]
MKIKSVIKLGFTAAISASLIACNSGTEQSQDKQTSAVAEAQPKAQTKPNILWIITDDQRPDSVSYYNQQVFGSKNSPLGHVESPNIDKLASEGVLFTKAFTNSPVCGPSRGSMATGRYPFRNGHYAFELTHQAPDFVTPTVSQTLREHGYGTSVFGKEDAYIFKWGPGQGFHDANLFDYKVHFKHDLQKNGLGDLFVKASYDHSSGTPVMAGLTENVIYPDGTKRSYFLKRQNEELTAQDIAEKNKTAKEFDLLRAYTRYQKDLILAGENPQPADKAVDAYIVKEMQNYLNNADNAFTTSWGKAATGADSAKPQFVQLGFHLPHSPVLPPKEFRDRFKDKVYDIPKFEKSELEYLPKQLRTIYNAMKVDEMTYAEKQKAIQDYYAFCAYGDYLIGKAVETFKAYSEARNQEYLIIYTVGDHGWHLGEQGIEAKFGPWVQSVENAAIIVSSDKSLVPAGKVVTDLVEFVDFAPTVLAAAGVDIQQDKFNYLDGYNLIDVMNDNAPKRDYVLGELNLVGGPRAYLHTERFRFSMRTRPFNGLVNAERLGKDVKWALETTAEEAEMSLYDLKIDPLERRNLAYDPAYKGLANWFRNKLGNIVLGDGRIEVDWSKENSYHISTFAKGADDKVANIPPHLIP